MVLLTSSASYIEQSSLLISARPTTTRITTHYSLPRPQTHKPERKARNKPSTEESSKSAPTTTTAPTAGPISAVLTLKTYDPVSGVVLKYRTNRAAEVGRLMALLGRLGGVMARGRDVESQGQKQGQDEMDVDPTEGVSLPAAAVARSGTSTPALPGAGTTSAIPGTTSGTASGAKGKGKKKKGGK